jgi:hypothetical protein
VCSFVDQDGHKYECQCFQGNCSWFRPLQQYSIRSIYANNSTHSLNPQLDEAAIDGNALLVCLSSSR